MFKGLYRLLPQRTLHKRLGLMTLLMLPAHSLYAQTSVSLPSLSQDLINIVLITILTSIMLFKAYKFKKDAKDAQQSIWHQAHYDPQTELPNRTLFYAQLKEEVKTIAY